MRWTKMNVGDRVRYYISEFDGVYSEMCTVTNVEKDHAIALTDDGLSLWVDGNNEDCFTLIKG